MLGSMNYTGMRARTILRLMGRGGGRESSVQPIYGWFGPEGGVQSVRCARRSVREASAVQQKRPWQNMRSLTLKECMRRCQQKCTVGGVNLSH